MRQASPAEPDEAGRCQPGALAAQLDGISVEDLRRRSGAKWTRYGPEVIPAWIADMDFPVAPPIRRALLRAMDAGDMGYPDAQGSCLRHLFAERMARHHGWALDPELVVTMGDVVQSISVAIEAFTEPGDGVLVQTPVYPPFLGVVTEAGRRLLANPLVAGPDRYEIDPDGWPDLAGARMLLLCNPHNPTGRVFEARELATLAALALDRDLVVVADEIHADLAWPGHRHIPFASLGPEVAARTITLTSATKAFNIAGLRCSVAAPGTPALARAFRSVPARLTGGVGSLALAATIAAWQEAGSWHAEMLAYLDRNRRLVDQLVPQLLGGVGYRSPDATYLAWLDCRSLDLAGGPWRHFLDRAAVGLSDGGDFGPPGQGHVRLNFATSRPILTEILERMAGSLPER